MYDYVDVILFELGKWYLYEWKNTFICFASAKKCITVNLSIYQRDEIISSTVTFDWMYAEQFIIIKSIACHSIIKLYTVAFHHQSVVLVKGSESLIFYLHWPSTRFSVKHRWSWQKIKAVESGRCVRKWRE